MTTLFPIQQHTTRSPTFQDSFLLVDGKLVERTGQEAVRQWFELALRQQPDRVPIYRTSGEKRYGIDRGVLETKLPSGYA